MREGAAGPGTHGHASQQLAGGQPGRRTAANNKPRPRRPLCNRSPGPARWDAPSCQPPHTSNGAALIRPRLAAAALAFAASVVVVCRAQRGEGSELSRIREGFWDDMMNVATLVDQYFSCLHVGFIRVAFVRLNQSRLRQMKKAK